MFSFVAADVGREFGIPETKWTSSGEKLIKDILEELYSKIPSLLLRMSSEGLVCNQKKRKKKQPKKENKMSHAYLD